MKSVEVGPGVIGGDKTPMNTKRIAFLGTTGLLSVALLGSGTMKLLSAEPLKQTMDHLGYPVYLLHILGVLMVAAVVALWLPGFQRLKEWAYAGIAFQMTGAFASHLLVGDTLRQSTAVLGLLGLSVASYLLRPKLNEGGDT